MFKQYVKAQRKRCARTQAAHTTQKTMDGKSTRALKQHARLRHKQTAHVIDARRPPAHKQHTPFLDGSLFLHKVRHDPAELDYGERVVLKRSDLCGTRHLPTQAMHTPKRVSRVSISAKECAVDTHEHHHKHQHTQAHR